MDGHKEGILEESLEPSQRDNSLMSMGKPEAAILFCLYFAALVWATYKLANELIFLSEGAVLSEKSIIKILVLSSLAGSSVFYARKLYKAGINSSYNFTPHSMSISRISTFAYFVLRIPASAIFSLILYGLWRMSMDLSVNTDFKAEQASRYLFLVMGFFAGFSSGKFITYFERDGMTLAKGGADGQR